MAEELPLDGAQAFALLVDTLSGLPSWACAGVVDSYASTHTVDFVRLVLALLEKRAMVPDEATALLAQRSATAADAASKPPPVRG